VNDKPITHILADLRKQNESMDELLPVVYGELRRLAGTHLSRERSDHTLQPTALVHEAYLRLLEQKEIDWQSRAHFFGVASRLMREILIEHARKRNRQKRGGEYKTRIELHESVSLGADSTLDVLAVNEALERLEVLDPQQAKIVELRFFGGLTVEEVAEVEQISESTVKREWATAKLFLQRSLANT
jgi:RNA polymerase sigma-70 factor (ECF subfamily)